MATRMLRMLLRNVLQRVSSVKTGLLIVSRSLGESQGESGPFL